MKLPAVVGVFRRLEDARTFLSLRGPKLLRRGSRRAHEDDCECGEQMPWCHRRRWLNPHPALPVCDARHLTISRFPNGDGEIVQLEQTAFCRLPIQ